MKRVMQRAKSIAIMVLLCYCSIAAQSYIQDDGTTAPKWRIGNDRYVEIFSDNDSNLVKIEVNGVLKTLAFDGDIRKARNIIGGAANRILFQFSQDSTSFIIAPTNQRYLYYNNGWQWRWAWAPSDTTTVVRTERTITTSAPLRIDGGASADLSANRTLSILYNSTNLKVLSNELNTIQDIAASSSPTFVQLTLSNPGTTSSSAVRADRSVSTSLPLSGGGNLTADRTISLNYNSTNFKLTSNQLNTIQDIATTSSPTFYNLSLTNNFTLGGYVSSNLIPLYPDTYDLGSSTKLWRKGWLSEMEAILFAKNTITLLGGWFYVTKNAGTLVYDVNTSQTQIDFGTTLTANDFIVFRNPGLVEYMQIISSAGGSTYNVSRNKDGSGANSWPAGTPFAVLGYNGDGRIEFNAYDTPRISIIKQGTTYNSQTELIRIGDLNGMPGYSSQTFGAYFGDASSYFKYDQSNGAAIRGALYLSNGDNVSTVLNSKASQTDLNTLSSTVSTHTTQISQNTSEISLRAYQSDLNTLDGRVTIAEAAIDVNANNINLKVSKNDVINQINISTEGININASRLTIGSATTFLSGYDPTTKIPAGGAANDVNSYTTTINGGKITTNTITLSHLNFTPVQTSNVVASINASAEGITINANRLNLTGVLAVGTAANDINNYSTTISGNKVRSGIIQSNNWSSDAGSYYDLMYGTITLGGSSSPKFTVNSAGLMTATGGTIAALNFDHEWIYTGTKANPTILWNATESSIYVRPLLTNLKLVFFGQTHRGTTSGGTPAWTGHYGINAIDNSNRWVFTLDDEYQQIAGWNFDYQRFYKINSGTGFELSMASTTNITSGFAVWNPGAPKIFVGDSTSSMDWNSTKTNTLTIKGEVLSSQFSSTTTFDETSTSYIGTIVKSTGVFGRKMYSSSSYWEFELTGQKLWLSEQDANGTYTSKYITINSNIATRHIHIDGYNVPKFFGVTDTPPTSNLHDGDYYIGSTGTLGIYTGTQWRYYNLN